MIYYVSVNGDDSAKGTKDAPFKTINHAASIAVAGDTIRIHSGTYREWVDPKNSGMSDHDRIIYEAVDGEHPIIKGSEVITGWEVVKDTVWKKTLPNSMFGEWNPYAIKVEGDWMVGPFCDYRVHLGDVYINGVSMFEAKSMDDLYDNTPRITGWQPDFAKVDQLIPHPELTVYKWHAVVDDDETTIYCNFQEYNPNKETIEINVRPCCFYPKATGINYITLRGFEIAHAACPWAAATSNQIGMVGPHWSKGWIIEKNILHDAKCSAISLGKDERTGHNLATRFAKKTGHRHQLEAVFAAVSIGWSKETVGSHIVRDNVIYDCGQNGIVGNLGCIFSRIEHNHIYNIATKHEFWGHEIAGIKFHGPIDTLIINNNIHDCTLGMWLDWEVQGTRVTKNLFHSNYFDFMIEVNHGPTLIDHNLFMSKCGLENYAQGGAYVHNLFRGKMFNRPVMNRSTPYHFPHATDVAGYSEIYGGDDRFYNNIFEGKWDCDEDGFELFTKALDKYSDPEEYAEKIAELKEKGSMDYTSVPQTVWMKDNVYSGYATPSIHEKHAFVTNGLTAELNECDGDYILTLDIPAAVATAECEPVTTKRLGETRISAMAFEAPDGSCYDFSFDLIGKSYDGVISPGPLASLKTGKQSVCVWKK